MLTQSSFTFCEGVKHTPKAAELLAKGDGEWRWNDRPLYTYGNVDILSDQPTPLLASFLAHVATRQVGCALDVAGGTNGNALQDLMTAGLATRGLVTNYEDNRSDETRANPKLGHVDGDLIDPETWRKIESWKNTEAPKGFSAILCDPVAALTGLPLKFYRGVIHTLIDWTARGGALFVPVPQVTSNRDMLLSIARRADVAAVQLNKPNYPINAFITKQD